MHRRMLFKIGVTFVVGVGILLFYLVHVEHENKPDHPYYAQKKVGNSQFPVEETSNTVDSDFSVKVVLSEVVRDKPVEADFPTSSSGGASQHSIQDIIPIGDRNSDRNVRYSSEKKFGDEVEPSVMRKDHAEENVAEMHKLSPVFHSKQPLGFAIHLCVVACGNRSEEVMTMLKSAVLTTPHTVNLVFHIITEPSLQSYFKDHLEFWPRAYTQSLSFNIYSVTFPEDTTKDAWRKLFKPCASQRLFLPSLLTSVDSLIYVDTDVLFLQSVADLWSRFSLFNATQLVALVPESEDFQTGWYNRFATHPYYGDLGVNSGVMLMNLTRLRSTRWHLDMPELYNKYRLSIPWGDQDLINIYFARHPDQLYVMGCEWNYRSDHCKYMSVCPSAEKRGVAVLHGSKRGFLVEKQPAFAAVYNVFHNHRLGDNFEIHFLKHLEEELKAAKPSNCGKVSNAFLMRLRDVVEVENSRMTSGQEYPKVSINSQPSKNLIKSGLKSVDTRMQKQVHGGQEKVSGRFTDSSRTKTGKVHDRRITVRSDPKLTVKSNGKPEVELKSGSLHRARDIAKMEEANKQYDDDSDTVEKLKDKH
ncbi:glucoside xylosyltransferase 1 [Aplysia californica]|uniref:UDP-D-xylose:beta-D-glucoside alpha-1,3-D-xylosyltransferase n=1 Tax=Aplysia californica TaxID=6500 RepID=A0ABM0JNG3_APLCA|nr:glucoside xylosyltransferase 1 [Aplysia californica]